MHHTKLREDLLQIIFFTLEHINKPVHERIPHACLKLCDTLIVKIAYLETKISDDQPSLQFFLSYALKLLLTFCWFL